MKRILFFLSLSLAPALAELSAFEQDRKAILAMAGEFKVGFHFQETLSLHEGYTPAGKPYDEEAFEIVKVVEDSGRRIVLQHLLQVGNHVVKHWAQTWTYEDTEILEYQGHRTWLVKTLTPQEAKGKWSQFVTQVDDSPRYEGYAAWTHHPQASEWTATANRPKPRREEKREDYDLLVVTNRHTITATGWFHEQDNVKWARSAERNYPLCREIGFNPYQRVQQHDFTKANRYWEKTHAFWKEMRSAWDTLLPHQGKVELLAKASNGHLTEVIQDWSTEAEEGKAPPPEKIREALRPFVVTR